MFYDNVRHNTLHKYSLRKNIEGKNKFNIFAITNIISLQFQSGKLNCQFLSLLSLEIPSTCNAIENKSSKQYKF